MLWLLVKKGQIETINGVINYRANVLRVRYAGNIETENVTQLSFPRNSQITIIKKEREVLFCNDPNRGGTSAKLSNPLYACFIRELSENKVVLVLVASYFTGVRFGTIVKLCYRCCQTIVWVGMFSILCISWWC